MRRGKTLSLHTTLSVFLVTFAPYAYALTITVDDDGPADYKTIQAVLYLNSLPHAGIWIPHVYSPSHNYL